jgi:neutral ceramidase
MPSRLVAAFAALLLAAPATAAGLKAGAYAQDVTPTTFPISVNGGMSDNQAKGVNDRLHARCLVLEHAGVTAALVVVDSCMIPRELLDAAKAKASMATGIPIDHISISATHCHSAPTVAGVFQSDPVPEYVAFLTDRIAEGITKAHARLAPAKAGWAVGLEPGELFNRRWYMKPGTARMDPFDLGTDTVTMNPGYQNFGRVRPAGPTDPEVSVLSVQTPDGRPLALFANYSLHYVGAPALSADYFGAFAEAIGTLVGADKDFVGAMSNGTSGDVNNVNFSGPRTPDARPGERMRVVAANVAKAAFAAYQTIKHSDDVPLSVAEAEIELGVRKPSAADIERAKGILAKAEKGKPLVGLPQIYARETVLLAESPATVKIKLQAWRVGTLGIATIPCETFTEIGLELKKRSPLKPTFTVSLANGYNGYLPTPEQHKLGGYETWRARSSYLEVGASPKIVETLMGLFEKVAPK